MKSLLAFGLGLLSATGLLPGAAARSTVNGTKFSIDGSTKYYAGTNAYWIGFLTNDADVNTVMDNINKSGLKILRVWGFNDVNNNPSGVYFQRLSASGSTINTGANGLQRLDAVVRAAERTGVKLIINFVNFWDDYGGMKAYVTAFGGSKETWYTNTKAQEQYRKYIVAVVGRYVNSDAIFAWELANEPRCKGCSTDVIFKWASETSAYVRSLDPNRMITLGDEGFGVPGGSSYPFGYSEGVDFVKNLKVKDLDFGTFHVYPGSWGVPDSFVPGWVKVHADACKAAGKPCFFEEYGTPSSHCQIQGSWQKASRDLYTDGMAGDAFWQWGDRISSGQTPNDGNTVYYGTADAACMVTDHVRAINALG